MSLRLRIARLIAPQENKHRFNDVDRSKSLENRELQAEFNEVKHELRMEKEKLKLERAKAELEALRSDLYEDDSEQEQPIEDQMMSGLLAKFLNSSAPSPLPAANVPKVDFTENELLEVIERIPRSLRKRFLKLDENTQKKIIKGYIPGVSDSSIEKLLSLAKT